MSEDAIDSVKATPEPAASKPKRKPGKKAKSRLFFYVPTKRGLTGAPRQTRARLCRSFSITPPPLTLLLNHFTWFRPCWVICGLSIAGQQALT
jgi:hypothetical protein